MAANNAPFNWGKWSAILLILAAVIIAVWLLGPIFGFVGLFAIPAGTKTPKELQADEKAAILAADPVTVLASQPADLRTAVADVNTAAVGSALGALETDSARNIAALVAEGLPSPPAVTVTIADPKSS